jgi:hypothetical protein
MTDLAIARETDVLPYIYVDDVDDTRRNPKQDG